MSDDMTDYSDSAIASILAQIADKGIGAIRLKDSMLLGISKATLENLIVQAQTTGEDKVLILVKQGPELALA